MKRMARFTGYVVSGLLIASSSQTLGIEIVRNGEPTAVVVIPDAAFPVVQYAAQEFRYHVQKSTGTTLSMVTEQNRAGSASGSVFLGSCRETQRAGIRPEALPPNAFVIRCAGGNLFLAGHDSDGPAFGGYTNKTRAGTLFAVYEFLERQLGVRWLWPGELGEVIPRRRYISVAAWDQVERPRLLFSLLRCSTKHLAGWSSDQAKGRFIHDQDVWMRRHRFSQVQTYRPSHAFTKHWKRFGASHPEYFQLVPGRGRGPLKGDPTGHDVSMCVSTPEFWKQIVADWVRRKAHTWAGALHVGENDTPGLCACRNCRAWDAPDPGFEASPYWTGKQVPVAGERFRLTVHRDTGHEPSLADRYARFYLAVQREAERIVPKAKVVGFSYANYFRPPVHTKLNDRVFINIVPAFMFPWTASKRETFRRQWVGWHGAGVSLVLRPNYTLSGHNLPIAYARQLGEDFSFAAARGLIGTDFDSLLGAWGAQGPTLYLLGRIHVRPDWPVARILDEYYGAFGKAEAQMRRYFEHWEAVSNAVTDNEFENYRAEEKGGSFKNWLLVADRIFTPEVMAKGRSLLEAAKAACAESLTEQRVAFLDKGLTHAERTLTTLAAYKKQRGAGDYLDLRKYAESLKALENYRHRVEGSNVANMAYLVMREASFWDRSLLKVGDSSEPLPSAWRFSWDPRETGEREGWQRAAFDDSHWLTIGVDSPWEKQQAGQGWREAHGEDYDGIAWYRTHFTVPPRARGKRIALVFGAVDEAATVWVNDKLLLRRIFDAKINPNSWQEPFEVVVTEVVRDGGQNVVAVRVEDRVGAGGVWKPVWLTVTDRPDAGKRNLVANPGFEDKTPKRRAWHLLTYEKPRKYEYTICESGAWAGKCCAQITTNGGRDGRLVQKIGPVEKGKSYVLKVRIKTSLDFDGHATAHIGKKAGFRTTKGLWQEIAIRDVIATGDQLYLGIWVRGAGTVWVDGVELLPE